MRASVCLRFLLRYSCCFSIGTMMFRHGTRHGLGNRASKGSWRYTGAAMSAEDAEKVLASGSWALGMVSFNPFFLHSFVMILFCFGKLELPTDTHWRKQMAVSEFLFTLSCYRLFDHSFADDLIAAIAYAQYCHPVELFGKATPFLLLPFSHDATALGSDHLWADMPLCDRPRKPRPLTPALDCPVLPSLGWVVLTYPSTGFKTPSWHDLPQHLGNGEQFFSFYFLTFLWWFIDDESYPGQTDADTNFTTIHAFSDLSRILLCHKIQEKQKLIVTVSDLT